MNNEIKYLDRDLLLETNKAASREKRNRILKDGFLEKILAKHIFIVSRAMYHKKNEVRLFISPLGENEEFQLDCSYTRYDSFPGYTVNEKGEKVFKSGIRPYLNEREWQEIERKEPVRNQYSFRKAVLSAYKNICAVCDISDKELLRAAHIVDVRFGGTDTIDNGICLCVNHEIAFDKGLFLIQSNYEIKLRDSGIGITVSKIKLPSDSNDFPSPKNITKKNSALKK